MNMKTLELEHLEEVKAGAFKDFAGGVACGAAVASLLFNPFMAWIPAIGCVNYFTS